MAKEVEILVDVNKEEKNKAKEKIVKQSSKKKQEKIEVVEEPKGTVATLLQNKNVEVQVNDAPKVKPTTMVKVLLKEDHRCNIGGNWYCFTKGKHYNVPENVKNILMRANKLLPL